MSLSLIEKSESLYKKSVPVESGRDLTDILNQMKDIMLSKGGVGISAPQVGINEQFFVMNDTFVRDNVTFVINPVIDFVGSIYETLQEGCLSFPDKFVEVKRPTMIHVKFYNENWEEKQMYLNGIKARIFQHEYDHLLGKCIF